MRVNFCGTTVYAVRTKFFDHVESFSKQFPSDHVVLFNTLYKVVLIFKSAHEILKPTILYESYRADVLTVFRQFAARVRLMPRQKGILLDAEKTPPKYASLYPFVTQTTKPRHESERAKKLCSIYFKQASYQPELQTC